MEEFDGGVDHLRLHLGFVALDVHEDVRRHDRGDLGKARRAIGVIDAREHGVSARRFDNFDDAPIVRGHDDLIEASSASGRLKDVDDKRLSGLAREDFFRKARRCEASGNNADGAWSHGYLQWQRGTAAGRLR